MVGFLLSIGKRRGGVQWRQAGLSRHCPECRQSADSHQYGMDKKKPAKLLNLRVLVSLGTA